MPEPTKRSIRATIAAALLLFAAVFVASADLLRPKQRVEGDTSTITNQDLPGDYHKYYGQRTSSYGKRELRMAKLDLDGDFNYDGKIDNDDPADNGTFQQTPPGLVVGEGEMSKLVLRLRPFQIDIDGEAVVTLEVAGINRGDESGAFENFEEESAAVGHIRIWKDAERKILLADTSDPERRFVEWVFDHEKYPSNVPGVVPRTVYVEGIKRSPKFIGDIRILATVTHRKDGGTREGFAKWRKLAERKFRTSFDHILITVRPQSHPKEFVNANAEKVWLDGLPPVKPEPSGSK